MSVELTTAGAFSGFGRTLPPSVTSIVFTALRIPMALVLTKTALGLNGIWWSITISSIFKGVLLFTWFLFFLRGRPGQSRQNSHKNTAETIVRSVFIFFLFLDSPAAGFQAFSCLFQGDLADVIPIYRKQSLLDHRFQHLFVRYRMVITSRISPSPSSVVYSVPSMAS